jgi:hypothetical protein
VAICPPALVTHRPGAESGTRFAGEHSPGPRPRLSRLLGRSPGLRSSASQLLWRSLASPVRHRRLRLLAFPTGSGDAARAPDGQQISRFGTGSLGTCQGLRPGRNHPRGFARSASPSDTGTSSAPGIRNFRGSMAGLCLPLPTLCRRPRDHSALLRAGVVRETFTLEDFHLLLLPVSWRTPDFPSGPGRSRRPDRRSVGRWRQACGKAG